MKKQTDRTGANANANRDFSFVILSIITALGKWMGARNPADKQSLVDGQSVWNMKPR